MGKKSYVCRKCQQDFSNNKKLYSIHVKLSHCCGSLFKTTSAHTSDPQDPIESKEAPQQFTQIVWDGPPEMLVVSQENFIQPEPDQKNKSNDLSIEPIPEQNSQIDQRSCSHHHCDSVQTVVVPFRKSMHIKKRIIKEVDKFVKEAEDEAYLDEICHVSLRQTKQIKKANKKANNHLRILKNQSDSQQHSEDYDSVYMEDNPMLPPEQDEDIIQKELSQMKSNEVRKFNQCVQSKLTMYQTSTIKTLQTFYCNATALCLFPKTVQQMLTWYNIKQLRIKGCSYFYDSRFSNITTQLSQIAKIMGCFADKSSNFTLQQIAKQFQYSINRGIRLDLSSTMTFCSQCSKRYKEVYNRFKRSPLASVQITQYSPELQSRMSVLFIAQKIRNLEAMYPRMYNDKRVPVHRATEAYLNMTVEEKIKYYKGLDIRQGWNFKCLNGHEAQSYRQYSREKVALWKSQILKNRQHTCVQCGIGSIEARYVDYYISLLDDIQKIYEHRPRFLHPQLGSWNTDQLLNKKTVLEPIPDADLTLRQLRDLTYEYQFHDQAEDRRLDQIDKKDWPRHLKFHTIRPRPSENPDLKLS